MYTFPAFQSTRPIRGATNTSRCSSHPLQYFNPRAPYGTRRRVQKICGGPPPFQSTRPIRGATARHLALRLPQPQFQSTRPIRGATYLVARSGSGTPHFNPRAPYGARLFDKLELREITDISIHAPHTGRDARVYGSCWKRGYFNPRAPYGARRAGAGDVPAPAGISIHAPHTGRDSLAHCSSSRNATFQSTRPIRGATRTADLSPQDALNFNPRAPYGARRCIGIFGRLLSKFQSTRPIRGATILCGVGLFVCGISIHAPHTGRDWRPAIAMRSLWKNFNPRAPYGARLAIRALGVAAQVDFNPRAPYGARHTSGEIIA